MTEQPLECILSQLYAKGQKSNRNFYKIKKKNTKTYFSAFQIQMPSGKFTIWLIKGTEDFTQKAGSPINVWSDENRGHNRNQMATLVIAFLHIQVHVSI